MSNLEEDIEDLWKSQETVRVEDNKEEQVKLKKKTKCCGGNSCAKKETKPIEQPEPVDPRYSIAIPGTQKIFFKTYGCSHNTSDSEFMMGQLQTYGYQIVESFDDCDVCVINSCTVKNPSQAAFVNYVTKAKENAKKVVVAGCVPQGDQHLKGLEEVSMLGVTQIDRIVEVVEETLKGNTVRLLKKKALPSLDLPKIRKNKVIDIIPINTGCLGSCTYCKTKHARGKLGSYEVKAIVKAVLKAYKEGVKEIWLTSEDTGAYGRDINTDLPTLMMEILKVCPEDLMIRIGMTNPPYIMEHLEKMAKILLHPNMYAFLHIPVQSGSNDVLDKMNREYKREDFEYCVDFLRERVPNITIATDIICGFPTETYEHHLETMKMLEKYRLPVINISQFYPRPGTVAAKWKKVDTKQVKARSGEVTKLFNSYPNYTHLINTVQRVWVHNLREENKYADQDFTVAHTKAYVKVLIKKNPDLIGKQVLVKITEIHKWHIYGTVIDAEAQPVKVKFEDHFKGMYEVKEDIKNEGKEMDIRKCQMEGMKQIVWDRKGDSNFLGYFVYFLSIIFLLLPYLKL